MSAIVVPIGGCCCDEGVPCPVCGDCPAVIGSEYCLCLHRLVFRPSGLGSDCPAFDITFSPPICMRGVCGIFNQIVSFPTQGPFVYSVGGDDLTIEFTGDVRCLLASGPAFHYYLAEFGITATLGDCDLLGQITGGGFADTFFIDDHCDFDSMLGTYNQTWLNVSTFDEYDTEVTFSRGGTCPPTDPIGDGLLTEAANFMITEGGNFLIQE